MLFNSLLIKKSGELARIDTDASLSGSHLNAGLNMFLFGCPHSTALAKHLNREQLVDWYHNKAIDKAPKAPQPRRCFFATVETGGTGFRI